MKPRTHFKLSAAAACLLLLWLAWPFYAFYAHQDAVPMGPFGWEELSKETPASQDLHVPKYADAGKTVMAAMRALRDEIGAPAMSAAVGVGGDIVWRGAVGWADIASRTPATPATIFRVGSTSKAITATALARLVDKGEIDLDTPVSSYLGENPNPDWPAITPRQLASHMAGLPHYKENRDWLGLYRTVSLQSHYADVRDAVEIFDESPLLFAPGTDFHYSTLGTVLLGATMSEATGKSYRKIVAEEVLEPAGMTSTLVAPPRSDEHPDLATFYYREDGDYRPWRPVDLTHRLPGGGWASTPADLVRMGMKHLDAGYISLETRTAFWTPQTLANGEVNPEGYALGWRWREWDVDGVGVARSANHGGVSRGSQSWLLVFPDDEMAIAFTINANTEDFGSFGRFFYDIYGAFARAARDR